MMKAQASLEYLLVLSALFAFLLAFVPLINDAVEAAKFNAVLIQEQNSFQKIIDLAEEANVLGNGNSLSEELYFPTETSIVFNELNNNLSVSFTAFNKTKTLWRKMNSNIKLEMHQKLSGHYSARISCEDGTIGIEMRKKS